MNLRRYAFFCLLVLALVSTVSCKKKDEDEQYFGFSGQLTVVEDVPYFINAGESLVITPTGVDYAKSDPDQNARIYYAIYIPQMMSGRDTLSGTFSATVPDTLCTLNVTVYALAEGYNTSSLDFDIAIVDAQRSLTNLTYDPAGSTITDTRDGRTRQYRTTVIGGREWMSENLAYTGSGRAFRSVKGGGYEAMTDIYGMYYTWDEAMSACPDGWRLPAEEDWAAMASALAGTSFSPLQTFTGIAGKMMGDAYLNREKLWEYFPGMNISPESSYLNFMPTGYAMRTGSRYLYESTNVYSVYWTATEYDAEQAYCRSIYNSKPDMNVSHVHKDSFLAPVRCVRAD